MPAIHTVKRGGHITLTGIANAYGASLESIQAESANLYLENRYNDVNKQWHIDFGDKIVIPDVNPSINSTSSTSVPRTPCMTCTFIRIIGADNILIPTTEALQVSNFVTNTHLPITNTFNPTLTTTDPDNFRIEVETSDADPEPTLEVVRNGVTVVGPTTYTTTNGGSGRIWRSHFLRLVSDSSDDAASGNGVTTDPQNQTILVELGDAIIVKYSGVTARLAVGRPTSESNNHATNHRLHNIIEVPLIIHVLQNPAGNPCVTRAQVEQDVADTNERFAQCTVRFVADIRMGGAGDPGLPLPAALNGGFTGGRAPWNTRTLNPQETAIFGLLDADDQTLEVFYVNTITNGGGRGRAYPQAFNASGNAAWENFVVIASASVGGSDPHNLAHELAHVLLNTGHRHNEPATAVIRGGTTRSKAVSGTKRIGPYPDAAAVGVGNTDTTKIRTNAVTLP